MTTTTVKVAKYRNETDHLFRIARLDYNACVGVREIERWKETAGRALTEAKGLQCIRATAYDREQFASAIEAVTQQLIAADAYIAQLQSKSALTPVQRAAAEKMRAERPPVIQDSNVIIDNDKCLRWYNIVVDEMRTHDVVEPQMVAEFCDIAGVPN
jgi:hypothetical protein